MYKQYYKVILSLCLFIFIIAYYFNSQNELDNEISTEISRHIKLIKISNEISSYAKRAEGHMLLFLLLQNESDKTKVFKRADKLKSFIEQLDPLVSDEKPREYLKTLRTSHHEFILSAKIIFAQYESEKYNMFKNKTGASHINELHSISSAIRKIGVKLVDFSTKTLEINKELINKKNQLKYQALGLFTVITFIFLIVITYQSGKLTTSTKLADSLEKLSLMDSLTSIGNRRYFDQEYDREWRRSLRSGSSLALLFIDVDYFKLFNDTYGHSNGDNCLARVAQTLNKCLHRPTDIIARYGGEEFVIILPETNNPQQIATTCLKAIEDLQIPNQSSQVSDYVTISIGLGIATPDQNTSPDEFINSVDKALYQAKENGRNCISGA